MAVVALIAVGMPSALAASGRWRLVPRTKRAGASLVATYCWPGSTHCVAVGSAGQALIEDNASGTWLVNPTGSPPAGAYYSSFLNAVSCSGATFCAAVGNLQTTDGDTTEPLVATYDGSAWSFQSLGTPSTVNYVLTGVSCTAPRRCVAVGGVGSGGNFAHLLVETLRGKTWRQTLLPNPSQHPHQQARLTAVSCVSDDECVAVGYNVPDRTFQGLSAVLGDGAWTILPAASVAGVNLLSGVSCPDAQCVAVGSVAFGDQALVETYSAGGWSVEATPDLGAANLTSVSCPSSDHCVAVGPGYAPVVAGLSQGAWTRLPVNNPLSGQTLQIGVSCSSDVSCVAAGSGNEADRHKTYLLAGPTATSPAVRPPEAARSR